MPEPHCRIGRVKLKAGGDLDLRLIPGGGPQPRADRLVGYAKRTAVLEPNMAGFVLIAWDSEGHYRLSADAPPTSVIGRTLLPSWIAEAVRRELVIAVDVRDIIDNEYVVPSR